VILIEFVKQTIDHRKLDTTSSYVNKLSDQERQKRISQIDSNEIKSPHNPLNKH
jgi:hypothetical protein